MSRPLDKVRALLETVIRSRRKELLDTHGDAGRSMGWSVAPVPRPESAGAPTPMTVVCAWCGEVIAHADASGEPTHSICASCFDDALAQGEHRPAARAPQHAHSHYFGHVFDTKR